MYDQSYIFAAAHADRVFAGRRAKLVGFVTTSGPIPFQIINILGWAITVGMGFAIVYGVYDKTGIPQWNYHLSALYHATHRTAWGAAVCWVIIACATGHGGIVIFLRRPPSDK